MIPSDVNEKITKEVPSDVVMELAHQKRKMSTAKITILTIILSLDPIRLLFIVMRFLENLLDKQEAYDMLGPCLQTAQSGLHGVSLDSEKAREKDN